MRVSWLTPHIGSQLVDLGSALLLLTCFAIVAQRRLSACVDLFALQSMFLAMTAALVAFLTGTRHIYIAAALTVVVKVIVIPRVLKRVIERLNVTRELVMNINVPASLLICGALVMVAFFARPLASGFAERRVASEASASVIAVMPRSAASGSARSRPADSSASVGKVSFFIQSGFKPKATKLFVRE